MEHNFDNHPDYEFVFISTSIAIYPILYGAPKRDHKFDNHPMYFAASGPNEAFVGAWLLRGAPEAMVPAGFARSLR